MSRRMSCSITVDAVRDRSKAVTRRHVDTWRSLKAGDRLTLIEKGMGLAKGERQVVLAEVEVIGVRIEQLALLTLFEDQDYGYAEVVAEGFPGMSPQDFVRLWLKSHGNPQFKDTDEFLRYRVRRIEWRYLDAEVAA